MPRISKNLELAGSFKLRESSTKLGPGIRGSELGKKARAAPAPGVGVGYDQSRPGRSQRSCSGVSTKRFGGSRSVALYVGPSQVGAGGRRLLSYCMVDQPNCAQLNTRGVIQLHGMEEGCG